MSYFSIRRQLKMSIFIRNGNDFLSRNESCCSDNEQQTAQLQLQHDDLKRIESIIKRQYINWNIYQLKHINDRTLIQIDIEVNNFVNQLTEIEMSLLWNSNSSSPSTWTFIGHVMISIGIAKFFGITYCILIHVEGRYRRTRLQRVKGMFYLNFYYLYCPSRLVDGLITQPPQSVVNIQFTIYSSCIPWP